MKTIQINDRIHTHDLERKAKQAAKLIVKLGAVRLEVSRRHDSTNSLEPIAQQFAGFASATTIKPAGGSETKGKIFVELS